MNIRELAVRVLGPFYSAVHTLPQIASEPSCWPEKKRKTWLCRYIELLLFRIIKGSVNSFYNAYGYDVGQSAEDYVDECLFWGKIIPLNYPSKINHTIVLRDKCLFWTFMSSYGLPTPEVYCHSKHGHYFVGTREVSFVDWIVALLKLPTPFFLKDDTACCGHGVFKVDVHDGVLYANGVALNTDESFFRKSDYIAQALVRNSEEIDRLYSGSLNTARLITVWNEDLNKPVLFTQFYRVGANGNTVDNWAVGGLLFSIDANGEIGADGFFKNMKYAGGHGLRVTKHPETGTVFKGFRIPDYNKGLSLALRAHSLLPSIKSIGWDIAFTQEGPVLIEGNDDWEIAPSQIVNGGLLESAKVAFNI